LLEVEMNTEVRPDTLTLENGDRLSRAEFERRYQAMPHLKKAELIEGVVYVSSPVRIRRHAEPHAKIMLWLGTYQVVTPNVMLGDNPTVRLDLDNEPQPDALLRIDEERGGQSYISEDDYIEGAPELAVEVTASTASYDLHDKLRAYQRNGVQEYLVWLVQEKQFRWYVLQADQYVQQQPNEAGILMSHVFPGLWLAVNALLNGEMTQVLAVLQQGINSAEHQAFVEKLQ
jgi:Uma2 family endonuclease